MISGKFGIRNGVVGHGGTAAEMIPQGKSRDFRSEFGKNSLFFMFRNAGMRTASISCFAERHSAWWFYAGFNECYNIGRQGWESAEEAMPTIQKWLSENVQKTIGCCI